MINVETDFGPLVSLLLNSLLLRSLEYLVNLLSWSWIQAPTTLGLRRLIADSRIARRECVKIRPLALRDARSTTNFV